VAHHREIVRDERAPFKPQSRSRWARL
jgi:hypothetical protein